MFSVLRGGCVTCAVAGFFFACGFFTPGPVRAQTSDELVDQCANDNPNHMFPWDVALASCTKAIRSGNWSGRNLAWAYIDRCQAYDQLAQYDLAIPDCNQGIRLDPSDPNGFLNRGIAYKNKNEYDLAIADYDQALKLNPRYAKAYNNRGNVYFDEKDYDRAIADYDQAIHFDPRYADPYYGRGLAKRQNGDTAGGDADIAHARELAPGIGK